MFRDPRVAVACLVLTGIAAFTVIRGAYLTRKVNELVTVAGELEKRSDSLAVVGLEALAELAKVESKRVADSVVAARAIAKRDSIIRHTPIPPVDTFDFDSVRYVRLDQHERVVAAFQARARADADAIATQLRATESERASRILYQGLYANAQAGWNTERHRADLLARAVEASQCRILAWDCPSRIVVGAVGATLGAVSGFVAAK